MGKLDGGELLWTAVEHKGNGGLSFLSLKQIPIRTEKIPIRAEKKMGHVSRLKSLTQNLTYLILIMLSINVKTNTYIVFSLCQDLF